MDQKCRCGNRIPPGSAWCSRCSEIRDREVMHCIVRIRLATRLELSRQNTDALIMTYFEKGEKDEQDTLEETE